MTAEFAEFGVFFRQKLFTPRPLRLRREPHGSPKNHLIIPIVTAAESPFEKWLPHCPFILAAMAVRGFVFIRALSNMRPGNKVGAARIPLDLTKPHALGYLGSVPIVSLKSRSLTGRRVFGFLLFLAVLFLPLHFHAVAAAPQINNECSCFHGARTQTGLAPAPASWVPVFDFRPVVSLSHDKIDCVAITSRLTRAPPPPASA